MGDEAAGVRQFIHDMDKMCSIIVSLAGLVNDGGWEWARITSMS